MMSAHWQSFGSGSKRGAKHGRTTSAAVASCCTVASKSAFAGAKEPTAIIELGGAGEWGVPGASSYGPTAAVEFTPVKDWLEIEAGVAPMFNHGRTEWDTDLFKKPFTLSKKVEFMIGVGPQWTFSPEGTKIGAELAADFMF